MEMAMTLREFIARLESWGAENNAMDLPVGIPPYHSDYHDVPLPAEWSPCLVAGGDGGRLNTPYVNISPDDD